jgi:endonuclease YncB( thermonuclease family)
MAEMMHTPYADGYGQIVATWHAPTVDNAPARALMSAVMLRELPIAHWRSPDTVYVGDVRGDAVLYRITGWDVEEKALIVERVA